MTHLPLQGRFPFFWHNQDHDCSWKYRDTMPIKFIAIREIGKVSPDLADLDTIPIKFIAIWEIGKVSPD